MCFMLKAKLPTGQFDMTFKWRKQVLCFTNIVRVGQDEHKLKCLQLKQTVPYIGLILVSMPTKMWIEIVECGLM